ncbi:hypothetical protein BST81_20435 [Leptolyngbya sp. 'hensonii']|uniref:GDSL-type esterase/lipase family protein n=1 Tax=Leptolyngbya sp. 'hensonii' TaxID=1922337 RepID=UPI00094F8DF1|nr:GDSL-type esterase/lipase family protein [Leptolyngbya sp. 'hensonii']OLP16568.1 hypothetical protein BST81_20435 [Leptolyngbya sp. 'hensonii']
MSSLYLLATGILINGPLADGTKPFEPPVLPDQVPAVSAPDAKDNAPNLSARSSAPDQGTACLEFSPSPCAPQAQDSAQPISQDLSLELSDAVTQSLANLVEQWGTVQASQSELSAKSLAQEPVKLAGMPNQSAVRQTDSDPNLEFADAVARSLYRLAEQSVQTQASQVESISAPIASSLPATKSVDPLLPPVAQVKPEMSRTLTEFSKALGPASGIQLFQQRAAALKSGRLFTRLSPDSYRSRWVQAKGQPTYQQWKQLLAQEARAVSRGKGNNRLSVLLGDSLSLWFPSNRLPGSQFWLNQGISGDTSAGVLRRLSALSGVQADTIYLMVGINDLRRGIGGQQIVANQRRIVRELRQSHPQSQIILQSVLPTDLATVSNQEIRWINQQLAAIAAEEGASYLDLHTLFVDGTGRMNPEFTTDGLHLNPRGYEMWQWAINQVDSQLIYARGRQQGKVRTVSDRRLSPRLNLIPNSLLVPEVAHSLSWSS